MPAYTVQSGNTLTSIAAQFSVTLAALERLTTALRVTLAGKNVDSSVYEMLPSLKPYGPILLRVVPRDFREDVERVRLLCRQANSRHQ